MAKTKKSADQESDLQRIIAWIGTYPGHNILKDFGVDFVDRVPDTGAIMPSGLMELARRENLLGDVTVHNRYNFAVYYVFPKAPHDSAGASFNADWVDDFQHWVQEQSVRRLAPVFGNTDTRSERITAQNGTLYSLPTEGTAMYLVQLAVEFKKLYEGV